MVPKHVLNFPDLVQILENTCSENLQPHVTKYLRRNALSILQKLQSLKEKMECKRKECIAKEYKSNLL